MLFSKDLLKQDPHSHRSSYVPVSEDYDMIPYSLDLLSESNDQIRDLIEGYFKNAMQKSTLSESTSFREGFNQEFNFNEIILKIFGAYLTNIEKIYTKGNSATKTIIKDLHTINQYKAAIKQFTERPDHKTFDVTASNRYQGYKLLAPFEHYNYTNLDVVIPPDDSDSKFRDVSDSTQDKLESIFNSKDSIALIESLKKIYNDSIGHFKEEYIDTIRAYTIGKTRKIYEDEYDTKLFEYFHNNNTEPLGSVVKASEIKTSLNRFLNSENILKSEEKTEATMIKDITATREYILKHGNQILALNKNFDSNLNYILLNILKAECNYILDICEVYTIAYSYKWDAICNALSEDRRILFSILIAIMGRK